MSNYKQLNMNMLALAKADRFSDVEALINEGAEITTVDKDGLTIFNFAVKYSRANFFDNYIERISVNDVSSTSVHQMLIDAVLTSQSAYLVRRLFNTFSGLDANVSTKDYPSLLAYAAQENLDQIANNLINNGANVDTPDKSGNTPAMYAAKAANLDLLTKLLGKGANVHACNSNNDNLLTFAAQNTKDDVDIVEVALNKGLDINKKNKQGFTALKCAIQNGNLGIARYLIIEESKIAEENIPHEKAINKRILSIAKSNGHTEILHKMTGPIPAFQA